ncbi:MAG: DUF5666 domain-containing protein [Candidatus Doudnabacteria bacterium]|nr:DUF5666 domain-containing protein [Candidatus Doudnabacteria bacterium]
MKRTNFAPGAKRFLAAVAALSMLTPALVFAQTATTTTTGGRYGYRLSDSGSAPTGRAGMTPFIKHSVNATTTRASTVSGTVAGVSGESISLTGTGSSYTVDATHAKIVRKYGAVMAVADIQTGDALSVVGVVTGTNISAKIIRDNSQQQRNATFSGTVSSVNGGSFILETKQRGSQTVYTSSTTVFKERGLASVGINNVTAGENVTAFGIWDSASNTVTASRVTVVIKTGTIAGTLTAVNGTTLTVTAPSSSSTVYTVDASNVKRIDRRYGASTDLGALQVGDTLSIRGNINGMNVTATTVRDMSLQARSGTFVGTVSALNGNSFNLASKARGNQIINLTATTIFRQGAASTSASSLAVGETVTVSGVWDRTNSNVTANRVVIKVSALSFTGALGSLSGTMLSVTTASSTVYSVDAAQARVIYKNGHKGDISILQTGDSLRVYGRAVSGSTNVAATLIRDTTRIFTATSTASSLGH